MVGISLDSPYSFCYKEFPHVTSSLLAKSNINFVIKVMEERCGKCGILNSGSKLNTHPWFVSIKESLVDQDVYHTGTLVSKQWVVTAASIFVNLRVAKDNFKVSVGAKAFEENRVWYAITEVRSHPKYTSRSAYDYDIAMVKLKDRILDPIPHPSDVDYDTIRPICLPDYEADIPISRHSYLYGKEVHYSRHLTTKKGTITSHGECKSTFYNDNKGVIPQEYVPIIKHK